MINVLLKCKHCSILAASIVGIEFTEYTFSESASAAQEVCVALITEIGRTIEVTLTTIQISALGMCIIWN